MKNKKPRLTLPETASLGLGTMVGASIFALFGEIASLAGGWSWLAFLLGAVISLLSAYSYYYLSKIADTNGGLAEYLNIAWKNGSIAAIMSLCYFLSLIIVIALAAKAFGHYLARLADLVPTWVMVLAVAVLLLLFFINALGVKTSVILEELLVALKVIVLLGFVGICFSRFDPGVYSQNQKTVAFQMGDFVLAVALANLSFFGFAAITNIGGRVKRGKRIVPKSIFLDIAVVAFFYIGLDIAIMGTMPVSQIEAAKNYALADAAIPVLGHAGFWILGITAVVATSSHINGNWIAAGKSILFMSGKKQLPFALSQNLFAKTGNWADLIIIGLAITMVLFFDLSEIATVASLLFLMVHAFIPLGNLLNRRKETKANLYVLALVFIVNGGILAYMIIRLIQRQTVEVYLFLGMVLFIIGLNSLKLIFQNPKFRI